MSKENQQMKIFFSETIITVLDIYDILCFLLSRVFFSVASTWPHAYTDTDLHREFLPQSKQERVHINIRIFLEAVGFGMVSGMQKSPPFGWCSLFKWRTEHENHNALRATFSPFFAQCWACFYRIFRTHTCRKAIKSSKLFQDQSLTIKWHMTNLCSKWFHFVFLKTERCPKSCCSHEAWTWKRKKEILGVAQKGSLDHHCL